MMRTTLTLDDDVALQLEALRRRRKIAFKVAVNDALRAGLAALESTTSERRARYVIKPMSLGTPMLPNVDNIADLLALAEGEDSR